ncbi:MAG: hypothetical protein RLZZ382_1465, partial [Bacteroidota bacterium]
MYPALSIVNARKVHLTKGQIEA